MFDNHWIKILPKDYIWDAVGDGRTCILLIIQNDYEFAIMGLPIFQGYYTHHDMESRSIEFAPLIKSGKDSLKHGDIPKMSMTGKIYKSKKY